MKKNKKCDFAPGSHEAVKSGCICPQMDNSYGKGAYINEKNEPVFWFNLDCPLHGESKQVDPQERLIKIQGE